ncbi:transmembrane protein 120 homolog [Sitodiplosis mosellana]|uniref:transmembrane protein 120 homolog n=1 Tax=Sitodiplosis mosellana TaxID=263140 RepID=UPI002444F0F8|nr:transmembrane protein 120 homolog [Sitodiplosis mosellana]XP_055298147.1 transmembrane protein 120 homolog [Sitodiplosis mosellana]
MSLESIQTEWDELSNEFAALEDTSNEYTELLEKLEKLQQKCMKDISHQRYRISQISGNLKKYVSSNVTTSDEKDQVADLEKNIIKRKAQLYDIDQTLPQKNGTYLNIILGNVNVSILNRKSKYQYKDDYEKFKLILNGIGLFMAILNLSYNSRILELAFIFLLVWYYCTLTIRESILKVNGSRIKGWWRTHHFISTACAGVLLIWPQGEPWQLFRHQFMYFNAYISMVQFLQFRYQKGVLYRLKALGERHDMDITIEGFHSWMWRGLSFLLPFLFAGYFFQAYNSYALLKLSYHPDAPWQVVVLSVLFFILFVGNTVTTLLVIPEKIRTRVNEHYRLLALAKKEQKEA